MSASKQSLKSQSTKIRKFSHEIVILPHGKHKKQQVICHHNFNISSSQAKRQPLKSSLEMKYHQTFAPSSSSSSSSASPMSTSPTSPMMYSPPSAPSSPATSTLLASFDFTQSSSSIASVNSANDHSISPINCQNIFQTPNRTQSYAPTSMSTSRSTLSPIYEAHTPSPNSRAKYPLPWNKNDRDATPKRSKIFPSNYETTSAPATFNRSHDNSMSYSSTNYFKPLACSSMQTILNEQNDKSDYDQTPKSRYYTCNDSMMNNRRSRSNSIDSRDQTNRMSAVKQQLQQQGAKHSASKSPDLHRPKKRFSFLARLQMCQSCMED